MLLKLSVIVPLAPGEDAWRRLVPDLTALMQSQSFPAERSNALGISSEVLFAGPSKPEGLPSTVRWVDAPKGRGRQMNAAAATAGGEYLWFLHADSRLPVGTFHRLLASLEEAPKALHYFDLSFGHEADRWERLNAYGAWLRSRVLYLPFGDQGFCLSRDSFTRLGGFPEDARYGEDHLLVWAALRQGVAVKPVGARLVTSPRKYRERGWLKTTLMHQYLTYKQALPEAVKLVRERLGW